MTAQDVSWPPKVEVLDVPISRTSYSQVIDIIDKRPRDHATVIAVCNVHSVMTARRDPAVAKALREAHVATPDGVPLVWMVRRLTRSHQARVYGPDLMRLALVHGVHRSWRHYFLGATAETLASLVGAADVLAPGVEVVGAWAPPFGPWTLEEELAIEHDIRASCADIVWVGLGVPKQELWMNRAAAKLPGIALVGVGAAFDFISHTVREAPGWTQRAGLGWLYRLAQDPRRLWRRYVFGNPAFAVLAVRQLLPRATRREDARDRGAPQP